MKIARSRDGVPVMICDIFIRMNYRQLSKYAWFGLIIGIIFYIVIPHFRQKLPNDEQILGIIRDSSPVQQSTQLKPFNITSGNYKYSITPLYTYDIYGVVVSTYDASGIFSILRQGNPSGIKDICIVWGKNIVHNIFAKLTYSNSGTSCFISNNKAWNDNSLIFDMNALSDNHLLPMNNQISSAIRDIKVGDQVHFQGYLSDFVASDTDDQLVDSRNTSVSRNDTGNGAQEIIFVTAIENLKKWGRWVDYLSDLIVALMVISLAGIFSCTAIRKKELKREALESQTKIEVALKNSETEDI